MQVREYKLAGHISKGTTVVEGTHVAGAAALSLFRAAHLVASLFFLRSMPFHIYFNATVAAVWLSVCLLQVRMRVAHVVFDVRPLMAFSVALSGYSLFSYGTLYVEGDTSFGLSLPYIKVRACAADA